MCRALLDDPTRLQHHDLVGRPDRRQPVGDDQCGPTLERHEQRLLHRGLGFGVEVGRGLVEDDDPRAGEQQAGDRQPLALATGQPVAALADDRVKPSGRLRTNAPNRA